MQFPLVLAILSGVLRPASGLCNLI